MDWFTDSLRALGALLTSTQAPWWFGFAGVLAGGALTYMTTKSADTRRAQATQAEREEARAEARRQETFDLVSTFESQVEDYRLKVHRAWIRWTKAHPAVYEGEDIEWTDEIEREYLELRDELVDEIVQMRRTLSRIRLLDNDDVVNAASAVWSSISLVTPNSSRAEHLPANDTLQKSLVILRTVTKLRFSDDPDDQQRPLSEVRKRVLERRDIVNESNGVLAVQIPDRTHVALVNVKQSDIQHTDRAHQVLVDEFAESEMSAAVFSILLEDGSTDYVAIGLETSGEPVTNLPNRYGDDDELRGSLTHIRIKDAEFLKDHGTWLREVGTSVHIPESGPELDAFVEFLQDTDPNSPVTFEVTVNEESRE